MIPVWVRFSLGWCFTDTKAAYSKFKVILNGATGSISTVFILIIDSIREDNLTTFGTGKEKCTVAGPSVLTMISLENFVFIRRWYRHVEVKWRVWEETKAHFACRQARFELGISHSLEEVSAMLFSKAKTSV